MKTKKIAALLLAVVIIFTVAGCAKDAGKPTDTAITVTDMTGREIALPGPAEKIVTVDSATCEILYAIGAGDTLVGRGEYCDYPAEALEVESVQSGFETNVEQIIALGPQVVLMNTMDQTVEQVQQLEDAGIRVVAMKAESIEGVYEAIAIVGEVTGKKSESEKLIADMKAGFAELSEKADNTGKTVYFEVSPLEWGLWTAGGGTFMDEIATMLGLTNAFGDVAGWGEISEEQVIARDPDYIVTISMYFGDGPTPVEEIMERAGWESMKAITGENVFMLNSDEMSRPGPRLADAARNMYGFVYGDNAA